MFLTFGHFLNERHHQIKVISSVVILHLCSFFYLNLIFFCDISVLPSIYYANLTPLNKMTNYLGSIKFGTIHTFGLNKLQSNIYFKDLSMEKSRGFSNVAGGLKHGGGLGISSPFPSSI